MTSAPGSDPTLVRADNEAPSALPTPPTWRLGVAIGVWIVVVAGVLLLAATVWRLFGLAVGRALQGELAVDSTVEVFWTCVWIAVGLAVTAMAAIVARRWVALVLALLLTAGSALLALGLYPSVQPVVAPVEHLDPGPLPCQCHSGGTCDCPGG